MQPLKLTVDILFRFGAVFFLFLPWAQYQAQVSCNVYLSKNELSLSSKRAKKQLKLAYWKHEIYFLH